MSIEASVSARARADDERLFRPKTSGRNPSCDGGDFQSEEMHTFDARLLGLTGVIDKNDGMKLKICKPDPAARQRRC